MRAAWPQFSLVILASGAGLAVLDLGCGAPPVGPVPGVSTAQPESESETASAPPVAAPARQRWKDFASALSWPEAAAPVPALGHRRDGSLIRVRVEAPALEAYRQLAAESPMPSGARVLALLETPTGQLLNAYLLEKRAGAWVPSELDAAGDIVPGDGVSCLRCHVLAPTDYLFGVAQRAPKPPLAPQPLVP